MNKTTLRLTEVRLKSIVVPEIFQLTFKFWKADYILMGDEASGQESHLTDEVAGPQSTDGRMKAYDPQRNLRVGR